MSRKIAIAILATIAFAAVANASAGVVEHTPPSDVRGDVEDQAYPPDPYKGSGEYPPDPYKGGDVYPPDPYKPVYPPDPYRG